MRMIVGGKRSRVRFRGWRYLGRVVQRVRALLRRMFAAAPEGPGSPPPLAKAEALRQGARLSEFTDARSGPRVA